MVTVTVSVISLEVVISLLEVVISLGVVIFLGVVTSLLEVATSLEVAIDVENSSDPEGVTETTHGAIAPAAEIGEQEIESGSLLFYARICSCPPPCTCPSQRIYMGCERRGSPCPSSPDTPHDYIPRHFDPRCLCPSTTSANDPVLVNDSNCRP